MAELGEYQSHSHSSTGEGTEKISEADGVITNPLPGVDHERGGSGGGVKVEELPGESIKTKQITWDRARMLAMTRRKRINEFALGGFIAALPGSIQTIIDYARDRTIQPSWGHIAEIAAGIFFLALTLASLAHVLDPTSQDILDQTFPEMANRERFVRRARRWTRNIWNDFTVKLEG